MALQSLLPETESIPVPVQNLDYIFASVAEYKKIPGKRVEVHCALNKQAKPVYGFRVTTENGINSTLRILYLL